MERDVRLRGVKAAVEAIIEDELGGQFDRLVENLVEGKYQLH